MRKILIVFIMVLTMISCSNETTTPEAENPALKEAISIVKGGKGILQREARILCSNNLGGPSGTACVETSNGSLVEVSWQQYLVSANSMATETGYTATIVGACTSCGNRASKGEGDYWTDEYVNPSGNPIILEAMDIAGRISRHTRFSDSSTSNKAEAKIVCNTSYFEDSGSACVITSNGTMVEVSWNSVLHTGAMGGIRVYHGEINSNCKC